MNPFVKGGGKNDYSCSQKAASKRPPDGLFDKSKNPQIQVDRSKLKDHKKIQLFNYELYFPFQPYEPQLKYMQKVIQAIRDGKDALLQSPTGTGKTLSLLCSALGWLSKIRKESPQNSNAKIYYCSRTHSQITQVIQQLKKTVYKPKTVVLGSRDQMCVNQTINQNKGSVLAMACKKERKVQACDYYRNTGSQIEPKGIPFQIQDIQQLANLGSQKKLADIIFMPYNYMIDPLIRDNFELNFSKSVIIIDEGHNVEKVAQDAMSFELTVEEFNSCIDETKQLQKCLNDDTLGKQFPGQSPIQMGDIIWAKRTLTCMRDYLKQYNIDKRRRDVDMKASFYGCTIPGHQIYKILQDGTNYDPNSRQRTLINGKLLIDGVNIKNGFKYYKAIDRCVKKFNQQNVSPYLEKWNKILELLFMSIKPPAMSDYYKWLRDCPFYSNVKRDCHQDQEKQQLKESLQQNVRPQQWDASKGYIYIYQDPARALQNFQGEKNTASSRKNALVRKKSRVLAFWCLDPGLGFRKLRELNPISIILTSGTLSPLQATSSQLKNPFPVRLQCPHVVQNDQVLIQVMKSGCQGTNLCFTYQNRSNKNMVSDLGASIFNCIKVTPGGVLIFFSSYSAMNSMYNQWQEQGYIQQIEGKKTVFVEPKYQSQAKFVMKAFYDEIRIHGGAVILAVCRGKISEGLDFVDNIGRLVIIVGIPYPSLVDHKTTLKKQYLDMSYGFGFMRQSNTPKLNGKQWYQQQAIRAVNQAIGRVIRHANDYGSIMLVDSRYVNPYNRQEISKWLKERVVTPHDFKSLQTSLIKFFEEKKGSTLQKLAIQNQQQRDREGNYLLDLEQTDAKSNPKRNKHSRSPSPNVFEGRIKPYTPKTISNYSNQNKISIWYEQEEKKEPDYGEYNNFSTAKKAKDSKRSDWTKNFFNQDGPFQSQVKKKDRSQDKGTIESYFSHRNAQFKTATFQGNDNSRQVTFAPPPPQQTKSTPRIQIGQNPFAQNKNQITLQNQAKTKLISHEQNSKNSAMEKRKKAEQLIKTLKQLAHQQSNYKLVKEGLKLLRESQGKLDIHRVFSLFVRGLFGITDSIVLQLRDFFDNNAELAFEQLFEMQPQSEQIARRKFINLSKENLQYCLKKMAVYQDQNELYLAQIIKSGIEERINALKECESYIKSEYRSQFRDRIKVFKIMSNEQDLIAERNTYSQQAPNLESQKISTPHNRHIYQDHSDYEYQLQQREQQIKVDRRVKADSHNQYQEQSFGNLITSVRSNIGRQNERTDYLASPAIQRRNAVLAGKKAQPKRKPRSNSRQSRKGKRVSSSQKSDRSTGGQAGSKKARQQVPHQWQQDQPFLRCPMCYETTKNGNKEFKVSKCKHIACKQCWMNWLKQKLQCPVCRKRVRKNQLADIIVS